MRVSVSKVGTYLRCQMAYKYRYVDSLTRKKAKKALTVGKAIHEGLEQGIDNLDMFLMGLSDKYFAMPESFQEELGLDFLENIEHILRNYFFLESEGYIEELNIVELEQRVEATLGKDLEYLGFIDGIVEKPDGLYILERKSFSSTPPLTTVLVNTQVHVYNKLFKTKFKGVIFEWIKSKATGSPRILKNGNFSISDQAISSVTPYTCEGVDGLPTPYLERMEFNIMKYIHRVEYKFNPYVTDQIYKNYLDVAREIRRKGASKYPKYFRVLSHMTCNMCEFKDLCFAELQGADVNFIKQDMYMPKEVMK